MSNNNIISEKDHLTKNSKTRKEFYKLMEEEKKEYEKTNKKISMIDKEIINTIITKSIIYNINNKCSDGSSISRKLSSALDSFDVKYTVLDHEELSMFTSGGYEIKHFKGEEHSVNVTDEEEQELVDEGYYDLNVDHNHPVTWERHVPTYLSISDMGTLMRHTVKGDKSSSFLYRSISASANNGSRMTLIRNNNFNHEDNELDFHRSRQLLDAVCKEYYNQFKDNVIMYMTNKAIEYQDNHPGEFIKASIFKSEAEDKVFEEMGSLDKRLKSEGVYDSFEKCNFKLRITWRR